MKNQVFEAENSNNATFKMKLDDIFISLVIIFVALGSFGLGRLSTQTDITDSGILLSKPNESIISNTASVKQMNTTPAVQQGGQLVASKNGTKYHFPWCSGAKRMLEENKIWFASIAEARAGGYEPAANCKGLE